MDFSFLLILSSNSINLFFNHKRYPFILIFVKELLKEPKNHDGQNAEIVRLRQLFEALHQRGLSLSQGIPKG